MVGFVTKLTFALRCASRFVLFLLLFLVQVPLYSVNYDQDAIRNEICFMRHNQSKNLLFEHCSFMLIAMIIATALALAIIRLNENKKKMEILHLTLKSRASLTKNPIICPTNDGAVCVEWIEREQEIMCVRHCNWCQHFSLSSCIHNNSLISAALNMMFAHCKCNRTLKAANIVHVDLHLRHIHFYTHTLD